MAEIRATRSRRAHSAAGVVLALSLAAGCGSAGRQVRATEPQPAPTPTMVGNPIVGGAEASAVAVRGTPQSTGRTLTVYGRAGSFGSLDGATRIDTDVVPVAGWEFLPGQAAYFTAVDATGRVIIANEPQTDNQTQPTASTMAVSVFDPRSTTFSNVVIPTSTGDLAAVAPGGSGIGGADIGDLQLIGEPGRQRLVVVSTAPYNGWDPARHGVYPAVSVLGDDGENWRPTDAHYTAAHLRAATDVGAAVCGRELPTPNGALADCGGLAEIGLLPRSGLLVATRYFGHPEIGQTNGGIVVLDPAGRIVASIVLPEVVVDGRALAVRPREVVVDPTGAADDERFLVVYDVFADGPDPVPFTAQEYRYVAATATIEPVSAPFLTGGTVAGAPAGVETALYDHDGNLWIAEARSRSLSGGRLVRFDRGRGRTALATECAAQPGAVFGNWGIVCRPDLTVDAGLDHSLVRSLTEDAARHRVIAVTIDGAVIVADDGGGAVALQLPLGDLVDRSQIAIGPRKGAVDPAGGALWIPIQQVRSPGVCPSGTCPPVVLDQWLVRLRLDRLA